MKFGVNTFIWTANFDRPHFALLPRIKKAGFDGVELPLINLNEVDAPAIRKALAENGLECTFCSVIPSGMSLISEDAAVRAKTRTHLEQCIERAAEAGGKLIAGPIYSPVGYLPGRRRTADEWNRAVEGYQSLGSALEKHDVTFAIEPLNRFETYFLNTAEDSVALCDAVNDRRVGILFDTFHANIEEKNVPNAYLRLGKHLKHVHTCENDRGTPGSGHVDWSGVFRALHEMKYDGWLTIESFGFALGELSAAASIWRDLAPTPETIAFEGIKFLRAADERR
ncbi:MAG TPA: sugar phosphate isomerase/epimerase family protein [Bryobacteraceae bacterium]|nr:sugar phosphate isomerase/epimerase family protein [Bryobacteraceae bacterium]